MNSARGQKRTGRLAWLLPLGATVVVLVLVLFVAGGHHVRLGPPPLVTASSRTPVPVPPAGSVVAFIGDSYTDAAGPTHPRWSSMLSQDLGWREENLGRGGSAYINRFGDTVDEAVALRPMVVIVSGGRNDGSLHADAIRQLYRELRDGLPDARIYGVAPFQSAEQPPPWLVAAADEVRTSVEAVDGTYLDAGQPLRDRPDLVQPDEVHPTTQGHRALADAVEAALRRAA